MPKSSNHSTYQPILKNFSLWIRTNNPLDYFWSLAQDISIVPTVIKKIAQVVNYLMMISCSEIMYITTLKVSSVVTNELKLNYIGARTRKRLRKCLMSWVNKVITWSMRLVSVHINLLVLVFKNAWICLKKNRCWEKIMSGFALNVKILCWLKNKWKYSRLPKYSSFAWKDSKENNTSPKKLARIELLT